jgi:enoyl-CoA hydratase/carnithine racemase
MLPQPVDYASKLTESARLSKIQVKELTLAIYGGVSGLSYFQISKKDGIAKILINRAEQRNAFNAVMWVQLAGMMFSLAADEQTAVVIITGAGNSFASGADITQLQELAGKERHREYLSNVERAIESITGCPQPVIGMINGWAMGAGCELAISCDLRICAEEARFGIPAAKLGISLNYNLIQRLVNLVGIAAAKEMLLVGEPMPASRAYAIGLANQVVPAAELETATLKVARLIAGNAPLAVKGMKKAVNQCSADHRCPSSAAIDLIERSCFESEDFREGISAFLEKRKPAWKGK